MTKEAQMACKLIPLLDGQFLAPGEYGNASSIPECAPSRCTQSVMRAAYAILLDLVRIIGWDNFLHMRSLCFNIPGRYTYF